METSMQPFHKPMGFSIEDILSDRHCESSSKGNAQVSSCIKQVPEYMKGLDSARNAYGSMLWLHMHMYWESIRQYYQVLSVGNQSYNFQFRNSNHFLPHWFYDGRLTSKCDILNHIAGGSQEDKAIKAHLSRKLPLDSPLFELEKLASTKLSTWNSGFYYIF